MIEACRTDPIVAHVTEARTDLTIGRPGFADAFEVQVRRRGSSNAQLGEKGRPQPRDVDGVADFLGWTAPPLRSRRTSLPVYH
jgi:hypothetical protein